MKLVGSTETDTFIFSLSILRPQHLEDRECPEGRLKSSSSSRLPRTIVVANTHRSPSYFAASCGGVTIETLKKYIEQQDAEGSRFFFLAARFHPGRSAVSLEQR